MNGFSLKIALLVGAFFALIFFNPSNDSGTPAATTSFNDDQGNFALLKNKDFNDEEGSEEGEEEGETEEGGDPDRKVALCTEEAAEESGESESESSDSPENIA